MGHRGVAAIEHHVGVADGGKVAGTIHQQQRYMQTGFEKPMDQPACEVTLSVRGSGRRRQVGLAIMIGGSISGCHRRR